jgi:phage-related protein (TIGR01555 family)
MAKVSIKRAAGRAKTQNKQAVESAAKTRDSFQNFAMGLGIGTNNPSTGNTYGFNPVTRVRTELEWAYRGSWVAGVAVDVIADDMTREGVDVTGEMDPDEVKLIEERAVTLKIWSRINQTIKWSRLYGGCIAVLLIDGADYSKPLRMETVGPDQFKGLLVLDRWMIGPSLEDLVTEIGPDLGLPKFYTVESLAPALRGHKIHYSRCLRMSGDDLPYWQSMAENLWGMSVLERLFDRMTGFDGATTGASQLVNKSYLRYFKIKKYRDILGGMGGTQAMKGLIEMVSQMRTFASNEGITLIDAEDDMVTAQASTFSGMAEVLLQLAQQISGALQIPLVRLLGQSPAGLNSSGDSELNTYYDGIKQRQILHLLVMMTKIYRLIAQSLRIDVGDGFGVEFKPLYQMEEPQKAETAAKDTATVMEVHATGIISDQTALKELQHVGKKSGRWKSITDEVVEAASDEVGPPDEELAPPPVLPGAVKPVEPKPDEMREAA